MWSWNKDRMISRCLTHTQLVFDASGDGPSPTNAWSLMLCWIKPNNPDTLNHTLDVNGSICPSARQGVDTPSLWQVTPLHSSLEVQTLLGPITVVTRTDA